MNGAFTQVRHRTCPHLATLMERMPAGYLHHAAVRCAACGAFVRWLEKPETAERRRLNGFKLAKLAMCSELSAWEQNFVRSVSRQQKLSPKQEALVERLYAQYRDKGWKGLTNEGGHCDPGAVYSAANSR